MTIFEVNDTEVLQRCAACGCENCLRLDELEAGLEQKHGGIAPRLVRLPKCSCGATEFLVRSPDGGEAHPAPGSVGHLHQLLVNHVHAELARRERVNPSVRAEAKKVSELFARPLSAAAREKWFPRGLRIEMPSEEAPETRNGPARTRGGG